MAQIVTRTLLLMYMSVTGTKTYVQLGVTIRGHLTTGHYRLFVHPRVNQCFTKSTWLILAILGFLSLQIFHVLIYI